MHGVLRHGQAGSLAPAGCTACAVGRIAGVVRRVLGFEAVCRLFLAVAEWVGAVVGAVVVVAGVVGAAAAGDLNGKRHLDGAETLAVPIEEWTEDS